LAALGQHAVHREFQPCALGIDHLRVVVVVGWLIEGTGTT
jgi:hypothetical protein